jgi:hypothetical protein
LRFAASRCLPSVPHLGRSPVRRNPSIHAASSVSADAPVHAASAIFSAAPLRDVSCIGKAPALDADAPSAIVAQVECQINVAHFQTSFQHSAFSIQLSAISLKHLATSSFVFS